ncbi:MAG: triose-phosphate isomerase [Parcubacteria group bacterium]
MGKIIIANWKANLGSLDEARGLFEAENKASGEYPSVETVICPPFVFIEELSGMAVDTGLAVLGAQDVSQEASGPHTGEVTVEMLKGFGVKYVLVGHSDRRSLGDTDEVINKKIKLLIEADITPVLLVGEEEKNDAISQDTLVDQLSRGLEGLAKEQVKKVILTYEPVWAISTSKDAEADTSEGAVSAIKMMQDILVKLFNFDLDDMPKILYGGSVKETNVGDFMAKSEIAGAVVGGASLRPEEFKNILKITNENSS